MTCPRCSTDVPDGATDCPACGIIFAKWRAPRASAPEVIPVSPTRPASVAPPAWSVATPAPTPPPETLGITHAGWRAAGIGVVMAGMLTFFPLISFLLHPLSTLVHEIGHTVVFWVFGYPAIPAFDFVNGGGVTMGDHDRSSAVVGAWIMGALILGWWQRERKEVLVALAVAAVVYFYMFNTWRERLAISIGGHGGEILFGALFLYRGLTGWGCKVEAERPLYAFIGFMVLFNSLRLGFNLVGNTLEKAWYLQGKGGMDNDLVISGLYLNWKLEGMGRGLVTATLLAIPAAFWAASMRKAIGAVPEAEEEV
jgi:hypothetical protein